MADTTDDASKITQTTLRLPGGLLAKAAARAHAEGVSVNTLVVRLLRAAVGDTTPDTVPTSLALPMTPANDTALTSAVDACASLVRLLAAELRGDPVESRAARDRIDAAARPLPPAARIVLDQVVLSVRDGRAPKAPPPAPAPPAPPPAPKASPPASKASADDQATLRAKARALGLSASELARRSGVSKNSVAEWTAGRRKLRAEPLARMTAFLAKPRG